MTKEEIARAEWPPGEWDNEPDELVFESHGLPCLIFREEFLGHLCGYVGVTKLNPLYGVKAHHLPSRINGLFPGSLVDSRDLPKERDLFNGLSDYWFFGFGCMNENDLVPYRFSPVAGKSYRNFAYVKALVEKLAFILFHYEKVGELIESIIKTERGKADG